MSSALEVISRTGTATWDQLKEELGISQGKLGPVLRELLDAGHIKEDPQYTYHVVDRELPRGDWGRFNRHIQTATILNGLCPYRGGNGVKLDQRCPEMVPCEMSLGMTSEKLTIAIPVPVLKNGTHCQACVDGQVRESELGLKSRGRRRL